MGEGGTERIQNWRGGGGGVLRENYRTKGVCVGGGGGVVTERRIQNRGKVSGH